MPNGEKRLLIPKVLNLRPRDRMTTREAVINLPSLPYHYMQLPREVIVGKGTLTRVTEVVRRLGLSGSALIVAGSKSYEVAGKRVRELAESIRYGSETVLVEATTIREVLAVEQKITTWRPQVLFGVGGGSKIDVAKLSSARLGIPFISIPTTVSHDGIARASGLNQGIREALFDHGPSSACHNC